MKRIHVKTNNFNKARDEIKKFKDKGVIFSSESDDLNRQILEKAPINVLLINQEKRKDFQKQRNSGFNHVMAKIAKKNNIKIGINLDEIIDAKKLEKSRILARIRQNIFLCNKNKVFIEFISEKYKRDKHDLKSLGLVLGMPTWMTKVL